eukprot:CAMPEP_0171060454 /NCGR_PEP_ID=MMETSP0766_2-20121228/3851_1 /TAXON_ID=439317 /ORGANISM="Gambierdiscus australes, Strain CAWD 149" /LENGTH=240 /DNA_ID=CAMNT_0011516041 /DNA_START=30 /DNA_END=752 /DNA_ORIENTATION=-
MATTGASQKEDALRRVVNAELIQPPGPALNTLQQCAFAIAGQSPKIDSERTELFQATLEDEALYEGLKGAVENTAVIATLILAFVYESSAEPLNPRYDWEHPESPGELPQNTMWGPHLEWGLRVREVVLLLTGLFAAAMLMACIHNTYTFCLLPHCMVKEYIELAKARVLLVVNPFVLVGFFLTLMVLQFSLTREAFIGITAWAIFVVLVVMWLLYTGSLNWTHIHLMRLRYHDSQTGTA